jgi:arylsulfatase A-like enzyme
MLDFLDKSKLSENTIVIYSSDQGFWLGEHGWFDKRWMYEESLHTPLLVRWPNKIKPSSKNELLVSNLDFAPTLLNSLERNPLRICRENPYFLFSRVILRKTGE